MLQEDVAIQAIKNLESVIGAAISQAPNNTKLATIMNKLKNVPKG